MQNTLIFHNACKPKFQSNLKYQSISDAVTPHKGFAMKNVKSAVYKMLYDVGT